MGQREYFEINSFVKGSLLNEKLNALNLNSGKIIFTKNVIK